MNGWLEEADGALKLDLRCGNGDAPEYCESLDLWPEDVDDLLKIDAGPRCAAGDARIPESSNRWPEDVDGLLELDWLAGEAAEYRGSLGRWPEEADGVRELDPDPRCAAVKRSKYRGSLSR